MKAVSVVILIAVFIGCFSISESSAEVNVTEMIKIGQGRYWVPPSTRHLPVYVRTAGSVVGRNWWKAGLGWGSIAIIAGSVAIDFYKEYYGTSPISDFLAAFGIRRTGSIWEAIEDLNEGEYLPNQAALDSLNDTLAANGVTGTVTVRWYSTYQIAHAAQAGSFDNATGSGKNGIWGSNSNCRWDAWYHNVGADPSWHIPHHKYQPFIPYSYNGWVVFAAPNNQGSVYTQGSWSSITDSQAMAKIRERWGDSDGSSSLDKAAWETIEGKIAKDLDDGNLSGATSVLDDVNPQNSKTTKENMEDAVEDDINDETEPDDEGTGWLEQIYKILKDFIGSIGLTAKNPDDVPESQTQEQIINQQQIDTDLLAEKGKTVTYLESLWDSIDGLNDVVKGKIEALLGAGGACSVLSETLYGAEVSIDFCSIDWSAFRTFIIAIGAICACLIVLGIW